MHPDKHELAGADGCWGFPQLSDQKDRDLSTQSIKTMLAFAVPCPIRNWTLGSFRMEAEFNPGFRSDQRLYNENAIPIDWDRFGSYIMTVE